MHAVVAAFRAWRTYRGTGVRTRAFLAARLAVLPLRPLAREYAEFEGHVLGIGSGHGLLARWLAELNPRVTVDGYDVDARRIAVAQATEDRSPRVRIHMADVRRLDANAEFDAASAVDVIHHIAPADRPAVARALADAVRPGGILLVKDVAATPRWKQRVNRLHDRIVSGERTWAMDPAAMARLFADAGFEIERLDRVSPLSPYPHFILRARRVPDSR